MLVLALTAALAGCGGMSSGNSSPPAAKRAASKPSPRQFLRVHAARHAVELTLIAADGAGNNGFNFDGYGRGELMVSVPRDWRVTVHFKNAGSLRSSCAVVTGPSASRPAFAGATTPDPVTGLSNGETATFSFTATRVGTYRLASLVSGEELARMWDVLEVTRGGRPSISARPGP
jgi:hypothetical protein